MRLNTQKRGMKGMGLHVQDLDHVYRTRHFYTKSTDVAVLSAPKQDWFAWFSRAHAYSNVYNGRSYAEVLTVDIDKTVKNYFLRLYIPEKKSQEQRKPSTPISIPQVRPPSPTKQGVFQFAFHSTERIHSFRN